ncbi:Core-2/I-branching beta-1-6-N-acetylglucosaminyltransferase family protein [Striga hermonthica]|uniref:Core-2/I-branching beta-1-6-N-acetylglucosaminyltransferase family protein n=1 Tax=Striga hermonthica TaxID=68872 RepID=A0A9N7NP72_STRHE|nr:Core-2/I-branching beta-1-6-N-acetylglucosaminyltransferase family protein [Striga hermonthica]
MGRNKEKENVECRINSPLPTSMADSSIGLLKLISILIIFVVGVVIGLVSSSNINRYFTFQEDKFDYKNTYFDTEQFSHDGRKIVVNYERDACLSMDRFVRPRSLEHQLTDDELFWRASLVPQKKEFPFERVPKVAFMFLTRGPLPMLPLWDRFFSGHDVEKYSIYVHALPGFELKVDNTSVFYRRQIPSKHVEWGSVSLVDAEKRLLANALLDFSNDRFVLLSESCIPIYDFPTIYKYLTASIHSFVESYDDPTRYGRGRYSRRMNPKIHLSDWRKGSQWFEMHRDLAVKIVADTRYYTLFKKYCKPSCYPDEHYIPTYIKKFHGESNANRTVTYVDWSQLGPHPATFTASNITESFLESLRKNGTSCTYNHGETDICYLFARKFDPSALEPLLNLTSQVMGF